MSFDLSVPIEMKHHRLSRSVFSLLWKHDRQTRTLTLKWKSPKSVFLFLFIFLRQSHKILFYFFKRIDGILFTKNLKTRFSSEGQETWSGIAWQGTIELSFFYSFNWNIVATVQLLSRAWLFATPRTAACQASLSITHWGHTTVPRQERVKEQIPDSQLKTPDCAFSSSHTCSLETIYENSINNLGRNKFLSKPNLQMKSKIGNTISDAGRLQEDQNPTVCC